MTAYLEATSVGTRAIERFVRPVCFQNFQDPALPDELKPVKTETSYIGGAVTLKPEYGSFDLFLPVTAVQEIRKTVMPLFLGGAQ